MIDQFTGLFHNPSIHLRWSPNYFKTFMNFLLNSSLIEAPKSWIASFNFLIYIGLLKFELMAIIQLFFPLYCPIHIIPWLISRLTWVFAYWFSSNFRKIQFFIKFAILLYLPWYFKCVFCMKLTSIVFFIKRSVIKQILFLLFI